MTSIGAAAAAISVRGMAGDRALDPSAVLVLAGIDPASLAMEDRVDLIRAWERAAAMVAGFQQEALAAVVDATSAVGLDGDAARHEVAAALRLSPVTAAERTRVAAALRDRLPATLAAMCRGEISWRHAAHLVAGVEDLPDELAAAVEARVLPRMPEQTAAETRRAVQAAVIAADPASAAERAEKAATERTIERMPQADSMASLWVLLPADREHDVWEALSERAKRAKAVRLAAGLDDPGIDALRVDCLVDAVLGTSSAMSSDISGSAAAARTETAPPTPGRYIPRCSCGGRQTAAVVVDLPTAVGLADNPGHLPGYGAIPGPLARRMATDRDWIRWTRDPGTRHIVDRGARTYRPSERMKAFIAARDRVCGFPGCNRPAERCDCDHALCFRRGGRTVRRNLGPLCRQHHNAKTHGRWRLSFDPVSGSKTWTSPLGKTYLKASTPLLT